MISEEINKILLNKLLERDPMIVSLFREFCYTLTEDKDETDEIVRECLMDLKDPKLLKEILENVNE